MNLMAVQCLQQIFALLVYYMLRCYSSTHVIHAGGAARQEGPWSNANVLGAGTAEEEPQQEPQSGGHKPGELPQVHVQLRLTVNEDNEAVTWIWEGWGVQNATPAKHEGPLQLKIIDIISLIP